VVWPAKWLRSCISSSEGSRSQDHHIDAEDVHGKQESESHRQKSHTLSQPNLHLSRHHIVSPGIILKQTPVISKAHTRAKYTMDAEHRLLYTLALL
jgi:hypothetical protein